MFGLKNNSKNDIKEMRAKLRREYEIQIASGFEEQLMKLSRIDRLSDDEVRRECRKYHVK